MSDSENPVFFAYHQIDSSVNGAVTAGEPRSVAQSWYDETTTNPVPNLVVKKEIFQTEGYFDIEWAYRPYYADLEGEFGHTLLAYGTPTSYPLVSVEGSYFRLHEPYSNDVGASVLASWSPNEIIRIRVSNLDGLFKMTVTVPNSVEQTVSFTASQAIDTDLAVSSLLGAQPEQGSDFIGINIIR
jgi:hypothetical protein